ncbi:MAG: response regulator [Candidatus Rokubacteria bacterium]|nr:response regulator [Candidatus Rokubacteria bacterium]
MSQRASVLVVDGHRGSCESVSGVLTAKGFTVETAATGAESLERLRHHAFDAAIVDITLPDVSGLELLRALRAEAPALEVVFITGEGTLQTAIEAIDGAAFAYLTKPIEMEHLLAVLRRAIERRRLTQALRESEERYRLIAENIRDGIFLVDPDGRVLFANRRAEELSGYSQAEFAGRPILSLLAPESLERAQERLAAIRSGQDVPPFFEAELVRKDGTRLWVEAHDTPIVRDDRVVGRLGVVRDVTERKRAEAELARQRDTLYQSEKLAAMGQLLAGVAHELNNPLSVVIGHAAILRSTADTSIAERANRIGQAAERCARIVKNFLALARQRPLEREEMSLNQIVREAVELVAYQLRVDDVDVVQDLAQDLPLLWADSHQFHQVLVNLVANAHQAMRETAGPRRLTLRTRAAADRRWITLEVGDTGPGVPTHHRPRLFEPFFTTKPAGAGTGLGLALCKGVVEEHSGRIALASGEGPGAVFRIELPVERPEARAPAPPRAAATTRISGRRVLVVDDEPDIVRLFVDVLVADGHWVETASDGIEALENLDRSEYDLILCDLRMPKLDGAGFYRELARRRPELLRRIAFITGDTLTPESTRFLEQVGVPMLTKPLTLDDIHRVTQQVLQAR